MTKITLKPGRVWERDGQRVLVVEHVYGQKPRVRVLGPAYEHKWSRRTGRGLRHLVVCERCGLPGQFARGRYCMDDFQQEGML